MVFVSLSPICKIDLLLQILWHFFFISVRPLNRSKVQSVPTRGELSLCIEFWLLGRAAPSLSKICSNSAAKHPKALNPNWKNPAFHLFCYVAAVSRSFWSCSGHHSHTLLVLRSDRNFKKNKNQQQKRHTKTQRNLIPSHRNDCTTLVIVLKYVLEICNDSIANI